MAIKLERPPVLDSPRTPGTPAIPENIALVTKSAPTTPKVHGGRWVQVKYESRSARLYSPPSVEVAKRFLRTVGGAKLRPTIEPKCSDTPVSSRLWNWTYKAPEYNMICHGCHGPMGSGLHNGSGSGKNVCSFEHALSCPGNIKEDDSWKSCPANYQPGLVSNGIGFEQTLGTTAFLPPPGSHSSTPVFAPPATQALPVTPRLPDFLTSLQQQQTSEADLVRFQRQVDGEGARHRVIRERIPSRFVGTQPDQYLDQEVADLRSLNQQAELDVQQASGEDHLTIQNIRATPGLRGVVDGHIQGFREQAPVLASAPSAAAPGLPAGIPTPQFVSHPRVFTAGYQYTASQLRQVTGDGIRVTGGHAPTQPGQAPGVSAGDASPHQSHCFNQELADVRSQYASLLQQQQQAEKHLELQMQQQEQHRQTQLAQEKAAAEVHQYRLQMDQVSSQLRATQDALSRHKNAHPNYQQSPPVNQFLPTSNPQFQHTSNPPFQPTHSPTLHLDQGGRRSVLVRGAQSEPELYEYLQGADGKQFKVLKSAAFPISSTPSSQEPPTRLEYRCSPVTGGLYQVRVPIPPQITPSSPTSRLHHSSYVWQKDQNTGRVYQTPVLSQNQGQQPHQAANIVQPAGQQWQQQHVNQQAQQGAGFLPHLLVQTAGHQGPGLQPHSLGHASGHQQHHAFQPGTDLCPHSVGNTAGHQGPGLLPHSLGLATGQQQHQAIQPGPGLRPHSVGHTQVPAPQPQSIQHWQNPILHQQPSEGQTNSEKIRGILNLVDKEGGPKKPKFIDYVKQCPVKWAGQVKPETMNLPVYAWGALAEVTASLSGRAEKLPENVILAKLQHLQSVLEVCCINSAATEYNNYGWVLARHYASKVQAKVDQQLTDWSSMPAGVQTADLVSAQMEYPKPAEKKGIVKKGEEDRTSTGLCTTYNTSTTVEKCDYEVGHPGRTCLRKHECTWCRKHLSRSHHHQVWKCAKKAESDK